MDHLASEEIQISFTKKYGDVATRSPFSKSLVDFKKQSLLLLSVCLPTLSKVLKKMLLNSVYKDYRNLSFLLSVHHSSTLMFT